MSAETGPTLPLPFDTTDAEPVRRRRPFGWLIALLVVLVLLVTAALAAEWLARDLVTKAVRTQVADSLGVADADDVGVDIPGVLLLQLARGTIDEATLDAPDVEVDGFSGAATVTVYGLALGDTPSITGGTAAVTLDAAQLRALMGTVDGFPADTIGLAAPNVTASVDLSLFGATTTVGLALTPSADGGDLVLTPDALTFGDAQVTAEELRTRFGRLADGVTQDWRVCVAQYLPAALTLSGVSVTGDRLVASFDIAAGSLTEEALAAKGVCP